MFDLPYYKADEQQEVIDFMKAHPFVLIVAKGDPHPVATQVPVIIEEREGRMFIRAHIKRKTDHHKALLQDPHVLVVFTGPHAYVSASWYPQPQVASTWNYQSVHVKGQVRFTDDADLLGLLTKLTERFENDPASPALVQHMPEAYLQQMMKAIVAFEIEVTSLDHVFKLSQNKDEATYANIRSRLQEGDADERAVAAAMRK